jgi:hypothetical protein
MYPIVGTACGAGLGLCFGTAVVSRCYKGLGLDSFESIPVLLIFSVVAGGTLGAMVGAMVEWLRHRRKP